MMQKILHNPLALKLALLGIICVCLFLLAVLVMRRMRRSFQTEVKPGSLGKGDAGFALAAYGGLAQQLREQEKELQRLREQHQQETTVSSRINDAVLSRLTCGVLFIDRMGSVRQANRAAKSLLGYASPLSFHVRDLFRGASKIRWPESGEEAQSSLPLVQALQDSLRNGAEFKKAVLDYRTPGGQKRILGLTASVIPAKGGEIMGLSCVLDDLTEITELAERVHHNENFASLGEISAGLANDFRKSLATVRGQALALQKECRDTTTRYHAEQVIAELDSLARILDEFLEFAGSTKPHR